MNNFEASHSLHSNLKDPENTVIVVTGISGFLGSHIAKQLLAMGYQVRGTLRSMKRAADIQALIIQNGIQDKNRLSFHEADLLNDRGWENAVKGADYVIHAASPFLTYVPKSEDEVIKPAVEGTKRVLQAAVKAGVKRVVLTSSIAAVIYGDGQSPYNESHWTGNDPKKVTPYYKSKTLAEQFAWNFAKENNLELSVINPGAILGPVLEKDYGTSAEIVVKLLKGEFIGLPNIGFAMVDVRDVAELHIRALFHPKAAGERFIAAADFKWFSEVAETLRKGYPEYDKAIPKRNLPSWLVKLVSRFDPAIKTVVKDLDNERRVSNHKARSTLGWQPRSSEEAILATAESVLEQGIV
ncbi:SDR family oxidoreductase [Vibrio sonorensis]|uniref:SDR family oxidoreductase n=1 Tax=Vibrio sonorensis TaxID=1004316 RepID=UPI000A0602C1|nr:aldehyde reductase [Vibrio sonorensis]